MTARTYEISPSVENYFKSERQWTSNIFQNEKRNFLTLSGHAMFYSLYKHQWNIKPFHVHLAAKGVLRYVTIATMIFLHMSR